MRWCIDQRLIRTRLKLEQWSCPYPLPLQHTHAHTATIVLTNTTQAQTQTLFMDQLAKFINQKLTTEKVSRTMFTGTKKRAPLFTVFTLWSCERAVRCNFLPKNSFQYNTEIIISTLKHCHVHSRIKKKYAFVFQPWPDMGTALTSEWVIIQNPCRNCKYK